MPTAGNSLSEEAKKMMKASKQAKQLSQYDWDKAEPYLDVQLSSGARNRKLKFPTLREFKQLALEGQSMTDLRKQSYAKHVLQFYANFLKGKITFSKAEFETLYRSGLSLDEISKKHSITREDLTFLRELYDIDALGATFIHRKETEVPLTQRQKEILYGSMMGDAKRTSDSSAGFGHGTHQKEYLLWKYKEFENLACEGSLKSTTSIDPRSGNEHTDTRFYTHANTDIETIVAEFYGSGKKEISSKIFENLTLLSVAVWFMDDGKCDHNHRAIVKAMRQMTPVFTFCTESFSKESCENIQKWFADKYNINVRLKEKQLSSGLGYRIIVCNDSAARFVDLIRPYILPMFEYKIDYKAYLDHIDAPKEHISFSDIVACPIGEKFSSLPVLEQDHWIDKIVGYYQRLGFSRLISSPHNIQLDMNKVFAKDTSDFIHDDCIGFSSFGNTFLMSHFPNFWSAKAKGSLSPKEIFENKKYLSEIIRGILLEEYFPRKNRILRKLRYYRGNKAISGFMPLVAKAIYDNYCPENGKVLDFCGGYGGRLFGASASKKVASYTVCEVNFNSYNGLVELNKNLQLLAGCRKSITISNQDSIIFMKQFADKSYDLIFTSPPYFDVEEYTSDNSQSSKQYRKYGEWFENFLIPCISESMRISKRVIINIAKTGAYDIPSDLEKYFNKENIQFEMSYLRMPSRNRVGFRHDPLLIIEGK